MSAESPSYYPKDLLEDPEISQSFAYVTRKEYADGTVVLINEYGDITTFFPDGSIHREYLENGKPRYTPPKM